MQPLFLSELKIHPDWIPFLSKEILELLTQIEKQIVVHDFTPSAEKVLRFLELPLSEVKVVILGQDPYPQPGVATGRAFEVGTLRSWNEPFKNISLKNILRTLYKAYTGKVIKYNNLKTKFDNEFPVLSPQKLFKHWEHQGILLLNTSFTCEIGKPGSHKKNWEEFTSRLLTYVTSEFETITWFLWGNHAQEAISEFQIKNKIISQHPMMCYDKPGRETDFLFGNNNCFGQFLQEIDWTGFQLQPGEKSSGTLF
ncbi:MAG: uracil-DNA glycosylase [Bacteroidota bacterium]